YLELPRRVRGPFTAFIRVFVRNAWREAFEDVDEVIDSTGCLGDLPHPVWNAAKRTVDEVPSKRYINQRADKLAAYIRRKAAQFGLIADALGACERSKVKKDRDQEVARRVAAIREVLAGTDKVSGSKIRNVGDALIAVECPADHVLLTSNVRHFDPITTALGKVTEELPDRSKR
ncbi:MAG: hypothetical protein ACODAJ_06220, partial [Planctomycetota bacterium]